MQPDCCVIPVNRERKIKVCGRKYDEVLPTLVVMAGVNLFDEEIKVYADRWLRERKGLSTEVSFHVSARQLYCKCLP